jgi:hypothetical protein
VTAAIKNIYVSGPLRQAVYLQDGHSKILSLSEENTPRETRPNDLAFFFAESMEFRPIEKTISDGLSARGLQDILVLESRLYEGLDALLGGMDRRFSAGTRQRKISDGNRLLDEARVSEFVENRLFSAEPTQMLDAKGALQIAKKMGADNAEKVYRVVAAGIPAKIDSAFGEAARQLELSGVEATTIKWKLIEAGAFRMFAISLLSGDTVQIQKVAFSLAHSFASSAATKRILFAFAKAIAGTPVSSPPRNKGIESDEDNSEMGEETVSLEDVSLGLHPVRLTRA